jgi:hypothetical protein
MKARFSALFDRRVRGFRVVDIGAGALLVVLVLGVYATKTDAGREGANLTGVEKQIAEERRAIRLLNAELAHLEDPSRLQRLSTDYLGLEPVAPAREAPADSLVEVARQNGARAGKQRP